MSMEVSGSIDAPEIPIAIAATAEYARRAEAAKVRAENAATSLETAVSTIGLATGTATTAAQTASDKAAAANTAAMTAGASASVAVEASARVEAAMNGIATISVPALPHILDGLMPAMLFSAPSGAQMLNGLYV